MHLAASLFTLPLIGACTDTPASPTFRSIQPAIDSVWMDGYANNWRDTGFVRIMALPADSTLLPDPRDRAAITVETSHGDHESSFFTRWFCPGMAFCTQVTLFTADASTLHNVVYELGGRMRQVSARGATVAVKTRDDVDRLVKELHAPPQVYAQQDGFGCADSCWIAHSQLAATLFISYTPPIHHNGILELARGAQITVRYTQPTGAELIRTFFVP